MENNSGQLLQQNSFSQIYRGQRGGSFCLLKTLRAETVTPKEIKKMQNEFAILQKLDTPRVLKALAYDSQNSLLILEDFQGHFLSEILQKTRDLKTLLEIGIELSTAIGEVHVNNIIHKNLNPQNILIGNDGKVALIDFGFASHLSNEALPLTPVANIEGNLLYIAPEQTGRTGKVVDHLADIYAIGIILYELFTKTLPFESSDPFTFVHSLLNEHPKPPSEMNPEIPEILSDIILKCISKDPEDRYQSAFGLKSDLEKCLTSLQLKDKILRFPLGEDDAIDHYHPPAKLFGRDPEKSQIEMIYTRARNNGKEILFLKGDAGIGKSSLLLEVEKSVKSKRDYFSLGEFDQFKKQIPWHGVQQLLKYLIDNIRYENESVHADLKEKFQAAVGTMGQVLIDAVPEFKAFFPKAAPLPKIGPEETINRFNYILANFLDTFTKEGKTLILCLENLQWADEYSLRFFEYYLSSPVRSNLLFIGTYRPQEVSPYHNFSMMLERLRRDGCSLSEYTLHPLTIDDIQKLLQSSFKNTEGKLAEIVHSKTLGNPFFIKRFLKHLCQNEYLKFNPVTYNWEFSLQAIRDLSITDNVADFLSVKLNTLSPETQDLLKTGSVMGSSFNLELAARLNDQTLEQAILSSEDAVKEELLSKEKGLMFRFNHDRIQEAAYHSLTKKEKKTLHYKIAKRMVAEGNLKDVITTTDHFNEGLEEVRGESEKNSIGYYNYLAGQKTMEASAYARSLAYFKKARDLMGKNAWESARDYCLSLFFGLALSERMAGSMQESEALFDLLISRSRTREEKGRFYVQKLLLLLQETEYEKTLKFGREALKDLGLTFPKNVSRWNLISKMGKIEFISLFKPHDYLINIDKTDNQDIEMIQYLLSTVVYGAYMAGQGEICLYLILTMHEITLKHGMTEYGVLALVLYSAALTWIRMNKYEKGFKLGQIAVELSKKYPNSPVFVNAPFQFYLYANRWGNALKTAISPLKDISNQEMKLGNLSHASASAVMMISFQIFSGKNLEDVLKEIEIYEPIIQKMGVPDAQFNLFPLKAFSEALFLKRTNHGDLDITTLSSEIQQKLKSGDIHSIYQFVFQVMNVWYLTLNNRFAEAEEKGMVLIRHPFIFGNCAHWNIHYLYFTLALLNLPMNPEREKIIESHLKIIRRWGKASRNYLPGFHLLLAEKANRDRDFKTAYQHYYKALELSKAEGLVQEEALIFEKLTDLYQSDGKNENAAQALKDALLAYSRWGATLKIDALNVQYHALFSKPEISPNKH